MSKPFAGFMLALSLFMIFLQLTSSRPSNNSFLILWLLVGVFSVHKLIKKPARS